METRAPAAAEKRDDDESFVTKEHCHTLHKYDKRIYKKKGFRRRIIVDVILIFLLYSRCCAAQI